MSGVFDYSPLFTCTAATNDLVTTGFAPLPSSVVQFTTTGTLPAPLAINTDYYVMTHPAASAFYLTTTDIRNDWRYIPGITGRVPVGNDSARVLDNLINPSYVSGYNGYLSTSNGGVNAVNVAYFEVKVPELTQLRSIHIVTDNGIYSSTAIDVLGTTDGINYTLIKAFTGLATSPSFTLTLDADVTVLGFRLLCRAAPIVPGDWRISQIIPWKTTGAVKATRIDITSTGSGTHYIAAPMNHPIVGRVNLPKDMIELGRNVLGVSTYKTPPPANKLEKNYIYDNVTGTLEGGGGGEYWG